MTLSSVLQLTARRHVSFVLFAALVTGCAPAEQSAGSQLDDAGRPRPVGIDAQRIVSLSPPVTELLFDLRLGNRVVGRTRFGTYPPEAEEVPDIGDAFPPNLEAVFSVQPDLVIAYHSESNADLLSRLDAAGIASLSIRMDLFESVPRALRWIGDATGTRARADSLAEDFTRELSSFARENADARGMVVVWDNPPMVIGGASFLDELLTFAGATNVFGQVEQPSLTVSIEAIAAEDPDFLLVNGDTVPAFAERSEWQSVRAVRDRRFVFMAGTEFSWPSLRAPDAIRRIRTAMDSVVNSP